MTKFHEAKCKGLVLTARSRGVLDLRINWVPGHENFAPNEKEQLGKTQLIVMDYLIF